jgi:hypothetical protein
MLKKALIELTIISTAIAERSKPAIRAKSVTPESLITARIFVENIKVRPIIKWTATIANARAPN